MFKITYKKKGNKQEDGSETQLKTRRKIPSKELSSRKGQRRERGRKKQHEREKKET